jgi:hypothetical protein
MLANFVFLYGLFTQVWLRTSAFAMQLAAVTFALLCLRTAIRMGCVTRIYGLRTALGVPVRAIYANILNSAATLEAVRRFAWARLHGRPLKWLKTEHAYPNRAVLLSHKRPLGEILIAHDLLDAPTVAQALMTRPSGVRLGQHLIDQGLLTTEALYGVLSFQQGLPVAHVDPAEVRPAVARSLPEHITRRWRLLPFRIANGALCLATPDIPAPELSATLAEFTALDLRFHLMPPQEFDSLRAALL